MFRVFTMRIIRNTLLHRQSLDVVESCWIYLYILKYDARNHKTKSVCTYLRTYICMYIYIYVRMQCMYYYQVGIVFSQKFAGTCSLCVC
jgi:hypothetical protein